MKRRGAINAFAVRVFATLWVVLALGGLASAAADHNGAASSAAATPASLHATVGVATAPWVCLIRIEGSINPAVAAFIEDAIAYANSHHADALVIELDTPGGLLGSAQRIVKDLLNAPIATIV